MFEWVSTYLGDFLIYLVIGSGLIEVVPIKLNPWSWLAKRLGRAANGEVLSKVEAVSVALDKHVESDERSEEHTSELQSPY